MLATTSTFDDAAAGDAQGAYVAEVIDRQGATGGSFSLQLTFGSVEEDRRRDVRRTCTVDLVDPTGELTPDDATDLLAPFGNELVLRSGFVTSAGVETVPAGVFRFYEPDIGESDGALTIRIEGHDRAAVLQRAKLTDVYVAAADTPTEDAIADLAQLQYPQVELNLPSMGSTIPRSVHAIGDDPWKIMREWARVAGFELFFDAAGVLTAARPAGLDSDPTVTFAGGTGAVLLNASRRISTAADVYNGVVVEAEGTSLALPIVAQVWDEDPSSPMYSGFPDSLGNTPFGAVAKPIRSSLVRSQSQAEQLAQAEFDKLAGAVESIRWAQLSNPAVEAGDVAQVDEPIAGLDEMVVLLDRVQFDLLGVAPMQADGRRRFLG